MSDPEIDRRCKGCGASVRSRAAFCPQCGQSLGQSNETTAEKTEKPSIPNNATVEIAASDLSETQPLIAFGDLSETQPLTSIPEVSKVQQQRQKSPNHPPLDFDDHMGRVEKIRKVSSVVIDQAAYDPSLRFVLVAAFLFLVFLVLLLLSKVLG